MTETIVFPDALEAVVGYLSDVLDVPVGTRVPSPRPAEFVTVTQTGCERVNLVVEAAELTFHSWGTSDSPDGDGAGEALDLAHLALAHVKAMAETVQGDVHCTNVRHAEGPLDDLDLSGQPRFRFKLLVSVRGFVAA